MRDRALNARLERLMTIAAVDVPFGCLTKVYYKGR